MVRLDNLIYLFNSIFDAGRWPSSVFRGVWRILFTFVDAARADDDLSGAGAARPARRRRPRSRRSAARCCSCSWRALVWRRAIGHYSLGVSRELRLRRVDRDRRLICKATAGAAGAVAVLPAAAAPAASNDSGPQLRRQRRSASATPATCRSNGAGQHPHRRRQGHVFICRDAKGFYAVDAGCTHLGCDVALKTRRRSDAGLRLPLPRRHLRRQRREPDVAGAGAARRTIACAPSRRARWWSTPRKVVDPTVRYQAVAATLARCKSLDRSSRSSRSAGSSRAGCWSGDYLAQQGVGQLKLLRARRRIADVLADPDGRRRHQAAAARWRVAARDFGVERARAARRRRVHPLRRLARRADRVERHRRRQGRAGGAPQSLPHRRRDALPRLLRRGATRAREAARLRGARPRRLRARRSPATRRSASPPIRSTRRCSTAPTRASSR